jgi:hypothetical protein
MNKLIKTGLEILLLANLAACIPDQELKKDNILQTISQSQEKKIEKIICQWPCHGHEDLVLRDYTNDKLGDEVNDGRITVYSVDRTPVLESEYVKGSGISTSNLAEGKYNILYQSENDFYKAKFILDRKLK